MNQIDKISETVTMITNFVKALIYDRGISAELMWLRVRQEADYQLELLHQAELAEFTAE